VDTRYKILNIELASRLAEPIALVAGGFNVLRAAHIRELEAARRDGTRLLVVVLPASREYLSQPARAELVAALRMVDYVVIADRQAAHRLAEVLKASPVVSLEAGDDRRTRELKEHVHRRQT
jgi:bifunctional ADP-heptose synthase (sugar kinase/adenylyltransferase)